jgi:predicted alpha/beta-hydrolase family hydrolase
MPQLIRSIEVAPNVQISSVWAVPEGYSHGAGPAVVLAHGAGNDMHHPFMAHFHQAFAAAGLLSVKFNFPYKEAGRKAPDRMPLLEQTWRAVVDAVRRDPDLAPGELFFAGKSMGGRVASHLAAAGESCRGLIFLGYPLHPARQPEDLRVEHWARLACPVLFVQGSRDSLCDLDVLARELPRIPGPVALHTIEGGDHSFKLPASAGKSQEDAWREADAAIVRWMAGLA